MGKYRTSIIVALLFIFYSSITFAGNAAFVQMLSEGAFAVCDCSGTQTFCYTMEDNSNPSDVTVGTPTGCSDNDETGTWTGTPAFSSAVGQPPTMAGTLAFHVDNLDERVEFSVTAGDLINLDDFKITFDLYVVSFPASATDHELLQVRATTDPANNRIAIRIVNGGSIIARHYGNAGAGAYDSITISSISTGSWLACEWQAKDGVDGNDHYLACGATSTEEDDDFNAANDAGTLMVGDNSGDLAGEYYLDNLTIQPSDRY